MQLVRPLLELQRRWSALPASSEWLVERDRDARRPRPLLLPVRGPARAPRARDAVLLPARRATTPRTFSLTANDYGFGLLSPTPVTLSLGDLGRLLAAPGVEADILAGLNAAELGRRQFREIARVAGLVFQGYPGRAASGAPAAGVVGAALRRVRRYDPDNLLLRAGGARGAGAPARGAAHRRRARAPARQPRAAHAPGAADAVRVSAAGRDVPRGALDRGARGARRADGGEPRRLRAKAAAPRAAHRGRSVGPLSSPAFDHAECAMPMRTARSTSPAKSRSSPAPIAASASRSRRASRRPARPSCSTAAARTSSRPRRRAHRRRTRARRRACSTSPTAPRVKRGVDGIEALHGHLDILVNNAGIQRRNPLVDFAQQDWDDIIATNLTAPFLVSQAALPGMIARSAARSSTSRR